jgi:hypothetical protein
MKITSNLPFNTSLFASHVVKDKSATKVIIGGSAPEYLNIPAGSTIELEDKLWEKFAKAAAPMINKGSLTLTVAPKLSVEDQEAEDDARMLEIEKEAAKIKGRKKAKLVKTPEKEAK